ncbi:MAG: hypothetical protein HY587_05435 [Candidatus Omnitrophica bacterium]|nr:hypothetical protein [Candidatus Omnitrophota bacterium]
MSTIFHKAQFAAFGLEPVNYPTLIIFMGMLGAVLGILYWDIAEGRQEHRLALLRIGVMGKAGGSIIWLAGLVTGDLPPIFWFYAIWADIIWLPGFVYFYVVLMRESRA